MKWAMTLAVATAAVCLVSGDGVCGPDLIEFDRNNTKVCLKFVEAKATWATMEELCQEFGGLHLAKVDSDLHSQVVQYINAQGAGVYDDEAFWIGGTDQGTEGRWRWTYGTEDTAIPLGTPHWYPCNGQPNGGDLQNCLSLYTPDFFYHSLECDRLIMGICQL